MPVAELIQLIAPPDNPIDAGSPEAWPEIEREIGSALPSDYRQFINAYGSGQFARFNTVLNPFSNDRGVDLIPTLHQICGWEREFRDLFPERVPYAIYPEPGGLVLWGGDDNGNDYYWLPVGEPDEWQVVSNEVRGLGFEEHGCTMTEYLVGVLRGMIKPLAGGYPQPDDFIFEPFKR